MSLYLFVDLSWPNQTYLNLQNQLEQCWDHEVKCFNVIEKLMSPFSFEKRMVYS